MPPWPTWNGALPPRHRSARNIHAAGFLSGNQYVNIADRMHLDVIDARIRRRADAGDRRTLGIRILGDSGSHIDDEDASTATRILESTNIGITLVRPDVGVVSVDNAGKRISTDNLETVVGILRDVALVWTVVGLTRNRENGRQHDRQP